MIDSAGDVFKKGKEALDYFKIDDAYVKPKHLNMGLTSGNYQKFLASDKMQAEQLLKEVMRNGNIIDIADDGVSAFGYQKYAIIFDAEKVIGTGGGNVC